ncbi:MAG: ribose-phosphate pyrophosphokinase-like domain-containing protein [Methylococcales bacterium]
MNAPILSDTLLLGFSEYASPAHRLAKALQCPYGQVEIHRFPDGESKVRQPETLPRHAIVCRSLDNPNDKLIELLLTAQTARAAGVRELTLVAPYLCYMRQDMAFSW